MPIQQFAYDIPNDIAIGIMKGMYKRFGGVVRDASCTLNSDVRNEDVGVFKV